MPETSATLTAQTSEPQPKTGLQRLGELRDPLLVLVTLVYGVGYLVWSIHAYQENLGLLPALEPQYLAAGAIPVLILWAAWRGRRLPKSLVESVSDRVQRAKGRQVWVYFGIGISAFVGAYLVLSLARKYSITTGMSADAARWAVFKQNLWAVVANILLITAFLIAGAKWFAKALLYFMAFIYAFFVLIAYLFVIYPNIPQEFGGVRPRCAYLDITRNQISEPMQKELFPEDALKSNESVARSVKLQNYFADKEIMLVRPYDADRKRSVLEIRKSVVQAVTWCD